MGNFEVIARIKIRPGQLEGFKAQAAELMRVTREQDTQTIRYDWFIDERAMECEVHEAYLSEQGMLEHSAHVMEPRKILFEKYAYDHKMSFFGDVSPQLMELVKMHADAGLVYAFFQGLEAPAKSKVASVHASA